MIPTVKYQQGNIGVAFVFSCPGRIEAEQEHVCAGSTGDNLQILIDYMHQCVPAKFPSQNKDDYRITNASNKVHYKKLTGDTEASIDEIIEDDNLKRLEAELEDCDIVVCMGNKAKIATSKIQLQAEVLDGSHLSNRNLNYRYKSAETSAVGRKNDRIRQVGDLIISKIDIRMEE